MNITTAVVDMTEEQFWRGMRYLAVAAVALFLIGWATNC